MMLLRLFTFALLILSCKQQNTTFQLRKKHGRALGTTYNVSYFSTQKIHGINKSFDSIFKVVNHSMSTYISSSDISKINNGDSTIVVDQMFREVYQLSKRIHQNTNGFFDPTVGKLVNAWGFGPKHLKLKMTPSVIDSLKQFVGFSKIKLTNKGIIKKQNPNIYIDFNAIAKGYCIDRIAAYFTKQNIDNYLIELGGELISKGINLDKNTPWAVGIDDPNQTNTRTLISVLTLKNKGMATSGNYRKYRIDSLTGKKYVHTINPFTGYTQISNVLSVSVLANDCATADGYATAFMAMPLNETKKILQQNNNLEAFIVFNDTLDHITTFTTQGFKNALK